MESGQIQFARVGSPFQGEGHVRGLVRGRCPRLTLVQPFGLRLLCF